MFANSLHKVIIGILSFCLFIITGLFLYSSYSKPSKPAITSDLSVQQGSSTHQTSNAISTDQQSQQPDKVLPVPVHQLKKIITEQESTEKLDSKITAANKAIAEIEKQFPNHTPQSSADMPVLGHQRQQDIEKRIEYLRNHLQKQLLNYF